MGQYDRLPEVQGQIHDRARYDYVLEVDGDGQRSQCPSDTGRRCERWPRCRFGITDSVRKRSINEAY